MMKCPTDNCDTPVKKNSKMLYCVNCRAAMNRAANRGPAYIKHRTNQLLKYEDRIKSLLERKEKR